MEEGRRGESDWPRRATCPAGEPPAVLPASPALRLLLPLG